MVTFFLAPVRRAVGQLAINFTALAIWQGMLVNFAVAVRYGWWGVVTEEPGSPLGCDAEAWLLWSAVGGLFACSFLRVYRYHNVLVLHNGFMWPVSLQLVVLLAPFLVPPAFFATHTDDVAFDEDTHECERQSDTPEAFGYGAMVVLAAVTPALAYSLRGAKMQVPPPKTSTVDIVVSVSFSSCRRNARHHKCFGVVYRKQVRQTHEG